MARQGCGKEKLEKTVTFDNEERSLTTRERLVLAEAELERRRQKTSTRTRERLAELEAQLEKEHQETSTRTREKLAILESKLASKRKTENSARSTSESVPHDDKTSSKTRERLAEVEKLLAQSKLKTSTRTREQLALKEEELKKLNAPTSTKTREKLRKVEDAIKKEKENRTSTKTIQVFRKKQEILRKMIKDNSSLDVAFLVDCTGSMAPYITETKNDIEEIVSSIKEAFENTVQVAFVGYRDHSDGIKRIECLQFTEDITEFKEFLSNINATGGGDEPEDVLGGIEAAVNLGWCSKNKVLFHTGDAPQHGARFHDMGGTADNYFDCEPRGLQVEDLFDSINKMKIKYFFAKINESTNKMIKEFKQVGGNENVKYTDLKSPELMGLLVVDSVTRTINTSVGKTMYNFRMAGAKHGLSAISEVSEGGKTLKEFSICEEGPEEVMMEDPKTAHWLECTIPNVSNLHEIKIDIDAIKHKWTKTTIKKASDPFAQGEQRIAFHGERIYGEKYSRRNESIVLKEFKHFGASRDRREDYIEIMETQAVSAFLANEFNRIAPKGSKEIQFLHVSVIQIFERDGKPKYFNAEVLLRDYKGRFKKWNNNCGYVSESIYSATLDAFSHWTYTATNGYLMVVDLQGVDRVDKYILTDPSVHCKEPRFGLTNLGDVGIQQFFKSHSCGSVCEALKLEKNRFMKTSTRKRLSKLYTRVGWK